MVTDATPSWGADAVAIEARSLPSLKARFVVQHLPDTGQLLEIGSGNGKILRTVAIHKPGLELYGCDVREPTRAPDGYTFRRMDRDLPFEKASLDVVLVVDVLEHVPDPRHLLAEAARVLRPGGRFVAFIPIEGERVSFYEVFRRLLGRDVYAQTKEHIQAFTHAEARALVAERFDITDLEYAYHLIGHLMDATFFAAARLPRLGKFWWTKNVYYNADAKKEGGTVGAMNGALVLANAIASVESTWMARVRLGSAGVLVSGTAR